MPDVTVNGLLPIALGVGGALLGGLALALPRLRRSILPALLLLVGSPLLAAVWWQHPSPLIEDQPTGGASLADYQICQIQIHEVRTVKLITDRGRRIPVGTPVQPVPLAELSEAENRNRAHELSRKLLVRTGPDPSHNCHGWIFTGGQFWIAGVVDDILTDNEYRPVSRPAVGDLAVYRGGAGNVVHTGIVRSAEGCILVESKWGPMSRCIHCPEDQPFGDTCTFYRSPREGHLLRGLMTGVDEAIGRGSPR